MISLILSKIEDASGNISTADKVANFMFEHSSEIMVALIILLALVICLSVFLILLWKYYKKDELILKKHKIDPANEDIDLLK